METLLRQAFTVKMLPPPDPIDAEDGRKAAWDQDRLRDETDMELACIDRSAYSSEAFCALKESIGAYINALVRESTRIAKRNRVEIASAAHVERARDNLVSSPRRRLFRYLGPIGGALLGAAISLLLSLVSATQYSPAAVLLAFFAGLIGMCMVAMNVAKD